MPSNAGDMGLIPGSGRSPGGENGNPLQYSGLGNPMDRGAWWATVCGVAKSQTRLSTHTRRLGDRRKVELGTAGPGESQLRVVGTVVAGTWTSLPWAL